MGGVSRAGDGWGLQGWRWVGSPGLEMGEVSTAIWAGSPGSGMDGVPTDVCIVSSRPRDRVPTRSPGPCGAVLVAAHGGLRATWWGLGGWERTGSPPPWSGVLVATRVFPSLCEWEPRGWAGQGSHGHVMGPHGHVLGPQWPHRVPMAM